MIFKTLELYINSLFTDSVIYEKRINILGRNICYGYYVFCDHEYIIDNERKLRNERLKAHPWFYSIFY